VSRHLIAWTTLGLLGVLARSVAWGAVLPGVPAYLWYYGCTPTSAGMIVGYWDGLPGYENLFDGDASTETQATRDMIASPEHLADPDSSHHSANCIADFMRTDLAGTTIYGNEAPGLAQYIAWDDPETAINESYEPVIETHDPWEMDWALFTGEIDVGRPVMLNMVWWVSKDEWYGHTVVGYGYQDDLFEISGMTVGGFAVRDTWPDGPEGAFWLDSDQNPVEPIIDQDGVEWWPWLVLGDYLPYDSIPDWTIIQSFTVDIVVPEPTTVALLAGPVPMLVRRRKIRRLCGR